MSLPFKSVDPNVVNHSVERRGFIKAPLDYANPGGKQIDIFYRLIPSFGSTHGDRSKPVVVVINGGPGVASSVYRPLEFDYADPKSPKNGTINRFEFLLRDYRILLVDQRGTDGQSAPLDMENPELDAFLVGKYFSSDSHARDYLAVINTVVPQGDPFFVIGQSYGGMPGMQYLALKDTRLPTGMLFTCAALPYEDVSAHVLARRNEQLKLNLELKKSVPDIESRLMKVRAHLEKIGINTARVHGLYAWLGKGDEAVWKKGILAQVDKILSQTAADIEGAQEKLGEFSLLNYILSSVNFTPGQTDRQLSQWGSDQIPFEPWMIDENEIILALGKDGTWREKYLDRFDANPPPATPFPTLEELRKAVSKVKTLFIVADNDAYVPADVSMKVIEKYLVGKNTEVRRLPGGHSAIFLEDGHKTLIEWSKG